MLAITYAFKKFNAFLLGVKVIMRSIYPDVWYLMAKKEAKLVNQWILLLYEFDFKVKDIKCYEYQVVDHLSHLKFNNKKLAKLT